MSGRFIGAAEVVHEHQDWGDLAWIARPSSGSTERLVIVEVTLRPGRGHAFHRHPEQHEAILVREGRVEMWLGAERKELGPGEAVYVPAGLVHASFAVSEVPVVLTVVLTPPVGDDGYQVIEVADTEPWASMRRD